MTLDPALEHTLRMVVPTPAACQRPWWLIGSAAMALHGAAVTVGDVDLLVDPHDAPALLARWGIAAEVRPSGLFRSATFARWTTPPLAVELMAGLEVRFGMAWTPVRPRTRVAVDVGGCTMFVPDVAELRAMLRLFGRPKDLERERLLADLA